MSPSAPAAASMLLSLPDEVLKLVLRHVPLKHRLSSCCLAHSRLHAAAMAATQQLEVPAGPQQQSVLNWLSLHGQHVTRLDMSYLQQPLAQLPCPNLLELSLSDSNIQLGPTADGGPGVVEALTKLTRLELRHSSAVDGRGVDSLSQLVHLRHLWWIDYGAVKFSEATLPRLRHLTHLDACLPIENILQLGALTSLRELGLKSMSANTDSSSRVAGLMLPPSLTQLSLTALDDVRLDVALFQTAPAGLRALTVDWYSEESPQPLLACIARLQCLTLLCLRAWSGTVWPPAGPAYSALTASSNLVSLELVAKFPAGVWPHVFHVEKQLPHLTRLSLNEECEEAHVELAFGAADLAALVRCCPGLCKLKYIVLQPGQHVSELHRLSALTWLDAYCGAGSVASFVQGLAAVTQLRDLSVELGTPAAMSVAALLPLTSLTSLTCFYCTWAGEEAQEVHDAGFRTWAGSPPDVWLRLLERCAAADPSCQPTALRGLAQQLAEQRALTARQQQQLAAQAQVTAAQEARIAALEGQLQLLLQQRCL